MPRGYALHIPRCRSVHTFTMRFPLDLIWLGKDGDVVRVDRDVAPNRHEVLPARPLRDRGQRRHRRRVPRGRALADPNRGCS